MLNRLTAAITPLRAHFEQLELPSGLQQIIPRSATLQTPHPHQGHGHGHEDDIDEVDEAESFARDVIIELMRNSVEGLKEAGDLGRRVEVMSEMHRIMVQDACTKDVFRELDGYLLIVSGLSILHTELEGASSTEETDLELSETPVVVVEGVPEPSSGTEKPQDLVEEGLRLAFTLLAESMRGHEQNQRMFETAVGYDHLGQAIQSLVSDARTVDETLGFLLALSLDNFALASTFATMRTSNSTDLKDIASLFGTLRHAQAFGLLVYLSQKVPEGDTLIPSAVWNIAEHLSTRSHRNACLMNELNFVELLLKHLFTQESLIPVEVDRVMLQKLLRRLLSLGIKTHEARFLFERAVEEPDAEKGLTHPKLNIDVLEVIKNGMKARWPLHFDMQGAAYLECLDEGVRGLPLGGFSFMIWMWIEKLPPEPEPLTIWEVKTSSDRELLKLSLRFDGRLQLYSACYKESQTTVFENFKLHRSRWTHVAFLHHPHRAANPTIRIFVDGVLEDYRNWQYPKSEYTAQTVSYIIGNTDPDLEHEISWSLASAHLLSTPIADDVLCLIHHLGPRYAARFQASDIARFLTYDASASLSLYFSSIAIKGASNVDTPLKRAIQHGISPPDDCWMFSLNPNGYADETRVGIEDRCVVNAAETPASRVQTKIRGDVFVALPQCLDDALWKIGGAVAVLRLVELASTPEELTHTLSILTDGLRASWQNSDDMERLHGYDILAATLRRNSQLINAAGFEALFEFLGLNHRSPDQSTIINTVAYRALALDFEIWSATSTDIQHLHLDHFTTLLITSKYKRYNVRQRLAKYGVIRKLLFVLQTEWYPEELIGSLIGTLKVVAQTHFSTDDTIKPLVSYLAANLHEDSKDCVASPQTINSALISPRSQNRAEQVMEAFVSILTSPACFSKFTAALPLTRICLLLLGEHPSSLLACQVLTIISTALSVSASFSRKFELVSGWTVLKEVIPPAWDLNVHKVAFDIFLGRVSGHERDKAASIFCPQMAPTILASMRHGLQYLAMQRTSSLTVSTDTPRNPHVEFLLEELMSLQSSSQSFRSLFRTQALTALVVDGYQVLVEGTSQQCLQDHDFVRTLEKMNHFVLSLTLDRSISSSQKRKLSELLAKAEQLLRDRRSNISTLNTPSHPLGIQVNQDKNYQKIMSRISEWRKSVIASERKRLRKTFLDIREEHRQASSFDEWRRALCNDRGLWKLEASIRAWSLDETEGPCRVRKKLEPQFGLIQGVKVVQELSRIGPDSVADAEVQSILHAEAPPWADNYEFAVMESQSDSNWIEEVSEDKHRRIRHQLEPGDVIEYVSSVTRIVGVDSSPGLLILGKKYLYMLDGLVENEKGEVVDVADAPKNILSVPGSLLELDGKQRAQRWSVEQVMTSSKRTCLFRDVALEIYFKDSRSLLIVFGSAKLRQEVSDRITGSLNARQHPDRTPMVLKTPLLDLVGQKVLAGFRDELSTAQRKWQAREISNFAYISILNQCSGRTPADATQYPVFPWILSDYSSESLDLAAESTFRDLTRPMGALTEERREAAKTRYDNLASVGEVPFHYGTHFSSSMIVCHFLIRLEPFTHMFKTLQGGDWDLPDRLFSDISQSYHSASEDVRGDVRELIPEFFTCPEFLENLANLDFGIQLRTGEKIHDVKLPPWAKQDSLLFISEHRRALESDFVSENLPAWIDLIWGCNQRDPDSLNVFHPFSYEGAINLDSITDTLEREATVGIIHNFGQTPRKIFQTPHPPRILSGPSSLPLGSLYGIPEDPQLLVQSSKPTTDIKTPIGDLVLDMVSNRIIACYKDSLIVPQYPHERITWGFVDQSLRLSVDGKKVQVAESTHCTCATFADSDSLVLGSSDCTVRQWQITRKNDTTKMVETHIMRAHTEPVICVTSSRAWSMILSGSEDGTAVVWDLNRAAYVRSISHRFGTERGSKVHLVAISESTGYIATCSPQYLCLHTINARLIAKLDLTSPSISPTEGIISSLAFHEREYSKIGILATGTSSGQISLRSWNTNETPKGEKAVWKFATLRTLRCRERERGDTDIDRDRDRTGKGMGRMPVVSALKFVGECLYHGEDTGKVFSWDLPD